MVAVNSTCAVTMLYTKSTSIIQKIAENRSNSLLRCHRDALSGIRAAVDLAYNEAGQAVFSAADVIR
jgi:RNase P/RNase MRP subunit POP5